jgi:hypothetical protein
MGHVDDISKAEQHIQAIGHIGDTHVEQQILPIGCMGDSHHVEQQIREIYLEASRVAARAVSQSPGPHKDLTATIDNLVGRGVLHHLIPKPVPV